MLENYLVSTPLIRVLTQTQALGIQEISFNQFNQFQISVASHAHVSISPPLELPADPR